MRWTKASRISAMTELEAVAREAVFGQERTQVMMKKVHAVVKNRVRALAREQGVNVSQAETNDLTFAAVTAVVVPNEAERMHFAVLGSPEAARWHSQMRAYATNGEVPEGDFFGGTWAPWLGWLLWLVIVTGISGAGCVATWYAHHNVALANPAFPTWPLWSGMATIATTGLACLAYYVIARHHRVGAVVRPR
jgi:hypothetical protein